MLNNKKCQLVVREPVTQVIDWIIGALVIVLWF